MNTRLNKARNELEAVKAEIDTINRAAADEGRDLTADEASKLDAAFDRAEAMKVEVEKLAAREAGLAAISSTLAATRGIEIPEFARAAAPAEMTAGEYLAEFYRAYHPNGGSTPEEFISRAARYFDRATQATADTAGILPTPIVGDVVKFADSLRPVFNALTQRPMPARGKTFERPRVTQRVDVGTQTEGNAAASQKMTLTSDTVTKATQAGYLDLTQQDIDWSEPSALDIVIRDFADTYAEWTEGLACDFIESLPVAADAAVNGEGYSAWDATNVETIVGSYVDGIIDVYGRSKRFPDLVFLDLASWGLLTSTMTGQDDRTALSVLRESLNEMGTGVRFVVGPQLAANTRILAVSSLVEAYEQQKGLLRAETPSTLTVQVAYSGYTAFWGRHEGVVQLGADPTP